jgi:hypothetical protein
MAHEENSDFFKGRGAQVNTHNRFLKNKYVAEHIEGIDEPLLENSATQLFEETPKKDCKRIKQSRSEPHVLDKPLPGLRAWLYLLLCPQYPRIFWL